ncbi:MAG: glycoside hydrolase family 1 protein [Deltaproteobacteria bacterium]|nr:glycoside hydrolase family 1 protein [Deltaproteobacteria bacterium]
MTSKKSILRSIAFLPLFYLLGQGVSGAEENRFPADFVWGVSTSAYQIEGGNTQSDWHDWERGTYIDDAGNSQSNIVDASRIGSAAKHYSLYEVDFDLARKVGVKSFHTSIEWSRIEPQRDVWDMNEVAHYREYLQKMKEKGLQPSISLFHVSKPKWFAAMRDASGSGWTSGDAVEEFAEFAAFAATQFGDLVDHWITLDEPVSYVMRAYKAIPPRSGGDFPPGEDSDAHALQAAATLLKAHAQAYKAIHRNDTVDADGDRKPALVSFVKSLTYFEAAGRYGFDNAARNIVDQLFNWAFFDGILDPARKGKINLIMGSKSYSEPYPDLADTLDYIGISYLSRKMVAAPKLSKTEIYDNPDAALKSDRGLEIYPQGLLSLLLVVNEKYHMPVMILGNGLADRLDNRRSQFIIDHVKAIADAMKQGVQVKGYYHWTLLHCFEWSQGYGMNYGLFNVDYRDPQKTRSWTEGARTYQRIVTNNGILE